MRKKFLALGLIVFMILCVMCGCSENCESHKINVDLGYVTTYSVDGYSPKETIIRTKKQFENFRAEYDFLNKDLSVKYTNDFFDSKSLLCCAFFCNTGGGHTNEIIVIANKTHIVVTINYKVGVMDVLSIGVIILEVESNLINNMSTVNFNINYEE